MNPKYPIYIISKGRWESRLTSKALERMGVPYHIVIEPQEYPMYSKVIDSKKIFTLPFSNLGQGSIPARNWVWEHAITTGAYRHWLMDDNIDGFGRFHNNLKIKVASGTVLKCMEDFVDRFENVAMAGPQYDYFIARKTGDRIPPYYLNTRIYSCSLIRNDLHFRWRGKYNEDTDLSLRMLKEGYSTILFYAFIQYKMTTMIMKGGNTDNVYIDGDNRRKFAESIKEQHPDVVEVTYKWGRWHHHVNYKPFRYNDLKMKSGLVIPRGINNYGMVLKDISENEIKEEAVKLQKDIDILKTEQLTLF